MAGAWKSLRVGNLIPLTTEFPHKDCRVCVVAPVRNEAEGIGATIRSFAQQVDSEGRSLDPNSYEVLILANNCTDDTAAVGRAIARLHPKLNLHIIEVSLPDAIAHVGTARRLVMNEAYRRLSLVGIENRIIASTDGDTEVSSKFVNSLISEFDKGVDAVGGRILTRRKTDAELTADTSLYFLRHLAHQHFIAQIEAFLDPQPHDCWPRHFQYYGANMSVLASVYGQVGGLPPTPQEEDVALHCLLKEADAKIRYSPHVQVITSARQVGRATGGLAELLDRLTKTSNQKQAVLVESPTLTEARILVREQLRQFWLTINGNGANGFVVRKYAQRADLLSRCLGFSSVHLRREIEAAPTFGKLIASVELYQRHQFGSSHRWANTEISAANMHLRQLLQALRRQTNEQMSLDTRQFLDTRYLQSTLQALKQIQTIPIFSMRH